MLADNSLGKNPDVLFDRNGNIQLMGVINKLTVELGENIYELIRKLLERVWKQKVAQKAL